MARLGDRMRNLEESLFWEIFYRHEVVRADLARLFNVSAATISRSVGVLLSKKLAIEVGVANPYRGRHPALLCINPLLAHVAGLELDRDRVTAVITDLSGTLLGRGAVASAPQNGVERTLKDCRRALETALSDAGLEIGQLARIGVGHTGTLDVQNGICLDWERMPHWRDAKLLAALRAEFQIEITLDDRARAVALALHLLMPEYRCYRSAIYVQIGTGIGAGIFVNGRMLRGATLAGGELGHIVIDRNGPLCSCGKRGCVEAFASIRATINRVRQALESGAKTSLRQAGSITTDLTAEAIISAARHGDEVARAALLETSEALATGIANAAQLLNPSLVVLAGKFANAAREILLEAVTRVVRAQCFDTVSRGLEIRVAPFRKDVGPVGCALLASLDVAAELLQREFFLPLMPARSEDYLQGELENTGRP
jgi:predicted NBD/HSP70 family sugar kinase